eukprot:TRINITY_DN2992_c0_g1_i2.p1 TRINITY_DN2992_c0_g1~~TRINITY_DN2992_c0_g1_i2.p1  ORF type:complete len:471 (+),score=146.51 TRINITY_DN2992_c0_g1_i2:1207-2619(+)
MALLIDRQGCGENRILTDTAKGTFLDVSNGGRGTPLAPPNGPQLVRSDAETGGLLFTLPEVTLTMFTAPAADIFGNIYAIGACVISESVEAARAVKKNGGKVFVMVGKLIEFSRYDILIPCDLVDGVIVHTQTEQTIAAPFSNPFSFLTLPHANTNTHAHTHMETQRGIEHARFINRLLRITPTRTEADKALARVAAKVFVENSHAGDSVDIGVGLPEEVSALLYETRVMDHLIMMNESGVFGGLSAPGVFFGAAVNPTEIVSSAEMFRRVYYNLDSVILGALEVDSDGNVNVSSAEMFRRVYYNLDSVILGALEVDSDGNVNVSKRGEGASGYVGPGGFIDLTARAKMIVFCCTFLTHTNFSVAADGRVSWKTSKLTKSKFVPRVAEITFNGQEALKKGKKVFYVTHLAVFRLTQQGVVVDRLMPGVSVEQLLRNTQMRVVVPDKIPVVPAAVVTGKDKHFTLAPRPRL